MAEKKWKKRKIDSHAERQIITGMIVSTKFLHQVIPILKVELLRTRFVRTVAQWCLDYYNKFEEAPQTTIEEVFVGHTKNGTVDETEGEVIEEFLGSLSEEYESSSHYNVKYFLQKAEDYLKIRALEKLSEEIDSLLVIGDTARAEQVVGNFKKITKMSLKGSDLIRDEEGIIRAIDSKEEEVLFQFPGSLGRRIGAQCRGDLFVIAGVGKKGKSFWLEEVGVIALLNGLRVVWFSFEMTEDQIKRRVHQNFLGETMKPETILIPVFDCKLNQSGECSKKCRKSRVDVLNEEATDEKNMVLPYKDADPNYVPCTVCRGNKDEGFEAVPWYIEVHKDGMKSERAVRKAREIDKLARGGRFHLCAAPASSMTVLDCEVYLDNLEMYENIVPDIVLFDYPKIMLPSDKRLEFRHRIDDVWQGLRALAQKRNILAVGADHSSTKTFGNRIRQGQQAEDNRVLNHVAGMIALNQTDEEKKKGVMNIGVLANRFEDFNTEEDIMVLECKKIGRPILDSY